MIETFSLIASANDSTALAGVADHLYDELVLLERVVHVPSKRALSVLALVGDHETLVRRHPRGITGVAELPLVAHIIVVQAVSSVSLRRSQGIDYYSVRSISLEKDNALVLRANEDASLAVEVGEVAVELRSSSVVVGTRSVRDVLLAREFGEVHLFEDVSALIRRYLDEPSHGHTARQA